jgi:hypothetical protein
VIRRVDEEELLGERAQRAARRLGQRGLSETRVAQRGGDM